MSDDLELELTDVPGDDAPVEPLVFIGREALEAVEAHAREDLDTELGGVLLGSAACSAEGTIVVVEAAIPALHTDASRGSVTFTHDTWEEINRVKDRDHPDKRIVGWYHTHPGFGLFLSEYDVFIHRNFFSLPWQVAFVVDPRAAAAGFFVWEAGEIAGPREFEAFGPPAPAAPTPAAPAAPAPAPAPAVREAPTWRVLMAAGLILLLALQLLTLARSRVVPAPDETTAAEVARMWEAVESLQAASPPSPAPAGETTYTVRRGDSLWRIAHEHYGEGAMWGAIAVANDIKPDELDPEMVLTIPLPASWEADKSGEPGAD